MLKHMRNGGLGGAVLFLLAGMLLAGSAFAQTQLNASDSDAIALIKTVARQLLQEKNSYLQLVTRVESGDAKVDIDQLRRAYLTDGISQRVWAIRNEIDSLRKDMRFAAQGNNLEKVRETARLLVTVKYVDIEAHKLLSFGCEAPGWEACTAHHRQVYLDLLNSVAKTGDGKTCATAWKVLGVDDENVIMDTLHVKPMRHEYIVMDGRQCDEIRVTDEGGSERNYYFDVADVPTEERVAAGLQ